MNKLLFSLVILFSVSGLIANADITSFSNVQSGFSTRQFNVNPSRDIDFGDQDFYASQVRASHILLGRKSEAEILRQKILDGEITFADAARKYSLCPSREDGGDLDFFPRGVMAGPFEKVAFELPIGQISQPVETRFGWHLILVTAKK